MLRQIAIFSATIIVLLGSFLFVERYASQSFQTCISDRGQKESNKAAENGDGTISTVILSYARCSGRFTDTHGAGITAIFTIILAGSTILLWKETNRAATAAKIAAEHIPTVERAWIFAGPTNIYQIDINKFDFELSIRNYGKTPGFVESIIAGVSDAAPGGSAPRYDGIKPDNTGFIVSPDGERIISSFSGSVFYGFIRYRDIFGDIHTSRFCVKIDCEEVGIAPVGNPAWNSHTTEKRA